MVQLSDRGQHCPFLNRADQRCGEHFRLERLDHAFEYCFDRYTACPFYLELLVERRIRRQTDAAIHHQVHDVQRTNPYEACEPPAERLIQLSIAGGSTPHRKASDSSGAETRRTPSSRAA